MGQWESSPAQPDPVWSSIADANSASYIPVARDAGGLLRATVVYTDGSGRGRMAGSAPTGRVDQLGIVTVSPQMPVVGKAVKATLSDPDGMETNQVWRWGRSPYGTKSELVWTAIAGAQTSSYTPVASEDSGKVLRVVVTYDDGTGTGRTATSSATERVDRAGVLSVDPSPPVAGQAVTATLTDLDGMVSNEVWKWERSPRTGTPDWEVITGATTSAYTPTAVYDGGKILRVTVGYDDAFGTGRGAVSPSTLAVDRPGVITLTTSMPVVGEALTATLTDGDGGVLNAGWQWERSPDEDPPEWVAISGAESATYTPSAALAGKLLRAVVTYDDATGRGRTASSDGTAGLDQRGTISLSSDAPVVGDEIRATLSDADGGVANEVWQWESSPDQEPLMWSTITSGDAATYTPVSDDAGQVLRAMVSYDDAVGTGRSAVSGATAAVDQKGAVALSPQQPVVGEAVTATLTDADGDIMSQVWQWERSPGTGELEWSAISGAESSSYIPIAPDDAGKLLRVTVAYTDGTGSGRGTTSAPTERVDQRGAVTLSTRVPDVGTAVRATLADGDGNVNGAVWQWQRAAGTGTPSWSDISDADEASYTLVAADEAMALRAAVSYDDEVGTGRSAVSAATQKVGKPGEVRLDSTIPVVGDELTATLTDTDGSLADHVWQWESSPGVGLPSWESLSGAAASYTPVAEDAGGLLRATVVYTDGSGSERMARSAPTGRVDQLGIVTVSPQTPVVGKAVKATLSDPDGMEANQVWRWERSSGMSVGPWDVIEGTESVIYTPVTPNDVGEVLRVTVTYDDKIGTGRTAVSAPTDRVDQRGVVGLSSNVPDVGVHLTATLTDPDGMVTNAEWQWQWSPSSGMQSWSDVPGAEGTTYSPMTADEGMLLRVTVIYDDAIGGGRVVASPATGRVGKPGLVSLDSGLPVAGTALTAMLTDPDDSVANVVWQWERSAFGGEPPWELVAGAESTIYTPRPSDAGRRLRAAAEYSDARGDGRTARSLPTAPVDQEGAVSLSTYTPEVGTEVAAALTDPDGGVANETWQWESSPDQPEPVWAPIVGAMSHTYIPESSDHGNLLRATVAYDDGTGTDRKAASGAAGPVVRPAVVVTLSAPAADAAPAVVLFNFPPSFADGEEASREIAIGRPGARAGVPVMATDLNGDGLTYLLTGRASAFFEVDPASGQVRIAKRLTYLEPGVYQVTLHAADPKGGVSSLVLSITVLQLTVPVFGEGTAATRTVPENSPVDTVVGFPVHATDPDGDTLAYSLSGTDELAFRVDAGTGQIRTREILDREIRPTYKVEVGVEDGRGGQDSIDVNIEVSDVNEPPILSSLISTDFIVGENSPSGTAVGEPFTALDPEEDRLAYFLSGDDASAFEIGTNTGQVMTKERLDHESRASYGMKVGVKDGRGGSDEVGLSIEVTDVNEAPTFSRETVVVLALPENSPAGAVVGEPLLANDPEGDTLAYSLSGDGAGAFAIQAKTGLMLAKRPFDFESRSSYLVRVTAGDGIGGDGSIYVTVNVMDVEELAPETIEEAISKSTSSADVLPASDADIVPDVIAPVDIVSSDSTDDLSTGAGTAASSRSDSGPASPFTDFSDTGPEAAVVTTEVVATVEDWEPVAVSEEGSEVDETAGVAPTIVLSEGSISEASPVAPPPVVPVVVRPVPAPQPFPLWLVLVIVALVCLDGILLGTLFYRMWGRPRPR